MSVVICVQVPHKRAARRHFAPDSSAESTTEDSNHSQKSIVYLHAATGNRLVVTLYSVFMAKQSIGTSYNSQPKQMLKLQYVEITAHNIKLS